MKKVGHTSEYPLGIYWWNLENSKNQNFQKIKKNCWRYHYFTHVYQKPQSYKVNFLRYEVTDNFLSFCNILCPFTPLTTRKIKILKPWKKTLEICTINDNHMIYGSWDMKWNKQNFFVILGHFLPFYPPKCPKNQNFIKMEKYLEISSFYICLSKVMIRLCMVPEIWCVKDGWTDGRMDGRTEKKTYRGGSLT